MYLHPNELFLICNPQSNAGKQTKAIALDLCSHINEFNLLQEKLSPTYWKDIVNMLGLHPKELLDQSHADYEAKIGGNTYTMDGWLEVLVHNAYLVKYPIVVYNHSAVMCRMPTDIMKLNPKPRSTEKVMPHLKKYRVGNQ
ncbi:MAG TPA: glutaredoxin [Cyclobacteriaceae bacterium]|nr:glutaredoxin [Cyclobacteriaceae bacterium]